MKRRQGNRQKEETTNKDNKMLTNSVDINPAIFIVTLYVNGLCIQWTDRASYNGHQNKS